MIFALRDMSEKTGAQFVLGMSPSEIADTITAGLTGRVVRSTSPESALSPLQKEQYLHLRTTYEQSMLRFACALTDDDEAKAREIVDASLESLEKAIQKRGPLDFGEYALKHHKAKGIEREPTQDDIARVEKDYVLTTLFHKYVDQVRGRARMSTVSLEENITPDGEISISDVIADTQVPTEDDIIYDIDAKNSRELLQRVMSTLPERAREILLALSRDVPYDEITKMYGLTQDSAYTAAYEARKQARELLAHYGYRREQDR